MTSAPPPELAALEADWPTLQELDLRYLRLALVHTHNNKTKAAEVLGIDRRTVSRLLAREHGGASATKSNKQGG
jgi:DNA-binding NtrC family response regulator